MAFTADSSLALRLVVRSLVAAGTLAALPAHSAEELSEVVVTTTAFHGSPEDVIHPIVVLDAADLQRERGSSLGETLARQPGLTASWFGPAASRPIIRGLSGERVQTLEDGLSSLDVAALSEDHAVSVDDGVADQVEILKGPATLLYGSGAVGGAVNVLTRRILMRVPDGLAGEASLRGDSALGESAANANLRFGSGPFAFHVDGYHRDSDDLRTPSGRVANSAREARGGSFGASLVGDQGFIGLSVSRLQDDYGIPFLEEDHAPGEPPTEEHGHEGASIALRQDRYTLRSEWRQPFRGVENLRLSYVHADYEHAEVEPTGEIGTLFTQQGHELRLTGDHRAGDWLGTLGLQYRQVDFEAAGEEVFVPPSLTKNLGLFAFGQFPLGGATIESGLRWERQTLSPTVASGLPTYGRNALSGSLGLLRPVSEALSVMANVTLSQRHPAAPELFADGPHAATLQFVIGDAALALEKGRTLDMGLRYRGGPLRWQLDAFVNDFGDYIYLAPTPLTEDGLPVFEYRQADARFTGLEGVLEAPLWTQASRELTLDLSADVVRARLRDGGGNLPQLPPWRVGAGLRFESSDWKAGVALWHYGRQGRVAAYETATDGYTLVEARVERQWLLRSGPRLTASLRGSNLTDQLARRHSSPLKDVVPLPGRGVTLSLRLAL